MFGGWKAQDGGCYEVGEAVVLCHGCWNEGGGHRR
jgi:hypothetical protein